MVFDNTPLFVIPEGVETRWASPENPKADRGQAAQANGGRKGSAAFPLKPGEQRILAEAVNGSGTIRRIWVTIMDRSPKMLRGLRLDFYWDGAGRPAVSAPIGDFFGLGLGHMVRFQSALFSSPEAKSFNSVVPMPFRKGMKIVVTNETDTQLNLFFYDIDYTLGDRHGDEALYFHAHYRRENPTILQKDYEILPYIKGKGRYLGTNIGVRVNTKSYFQSWWGEGEVKVYLDGDVVFPTLSGTGTEDYIGTGWGQGTYDHLYQGCPLADEERMLYGFYRYHVPDPVYFRKEVKVTIQQIGCWAPDTKRLMHDAGRPVYHAGAGRKPIDFTPAGGTADYGLFERQDDWSSCAYFYLDRPENDLPPLDSVERRIQDLV